MRLLIVLVLALTFAPAQVPGTGDPAPTMDLTKILGRDSAKLDLKNKVVLIEFWATW